VGLPSTPLYSLSRISLIPGQRYVVFMCFIFYCTKCSSHVYLFISVFRLASQANVLIKLELSWNDRPMEAGDLCPTLKPRSSCNPRTPRSASDSLPTTTLTHVKWRSRQRVHYDSILECRQQSALRTISCANTQGTISWWPQTMTMTATAMKTWKTNAKCTVKLI